MSCACLTPARGYGRWMSAAGFTVRRTVEEDWRQVRELRLEMLADTPVAHLETGERAAEQAEEHWRSRARRLRCAGQDHGGGDPRERRLGGSMTGIDCGGAEPFLVAVYVAEDFRGSGVTGAPLAAIGDWARGWASARGERDEGLGRRTRARVRGDRTEPSVSARSWAWRCASSCVEPVFASARAAAAARRRGPRREFSAGEHRVLPRCAHGAEFHIK